ncbi:adenylate/guanylate cyclase domain-containing protein [Terrarubrum flagellatum]|uniref:adenylate/guanylate cyclase domain-containing protein n=1 Tax=Terrirubrum flagellatum TaxID=2895980 RepID=UPI0031451484
MWRSTGATAVHRRLAAIVAADVVGFGRLISRDELGTLRRFRAVRDHLVDPMIASHHGRIVKTAGDGLLAEFGSVVDAVACSLEIQRDMIERNEGFAVDMRMVFRIGVNVGDIIIDGDDIHGDGVNVAARLEALCEPGGVCISSAVSDHIRDALLFSFADRGEHKVKNIARPIRIFGLSEEDIADLPRRASEPRAGARAAVRSGPPLLSIVVLPFTNFSNDPEQEFLADGITEDLTTDLSRITGSFVIARNTAFTYKGQNVDVRQVGRELGVRYVLEGSVRRAGQHVRLTVQLIEADTGAHIWAERFDGDRQNMIEIQNEVTGRIARTLNLELVQADARRTMRQQALAPTILDHIALGRAYMNKPFSMENVRAARRHFKDALALDNDAVEAMSGLAMVIARDLADGWSDNPGEDMTLCDSLLKRALDLDSRNADAHYAQGQLWRTRGYMDDAIASTETALQISPNHYYAMRALGYLYYFSGDLEKALAFANDYVRVSPRDPELAVLNWVKGSSNLQLGNVEEAIGYLSQARALNRNLWFVHYSLAGALGLSGRIEEAQESVAAFRALKPDYTSLAKVHAALPYLTDKRYQARASQTVEKGLQAAGFPRE